MSRYQCRDCDKIEDDHEKCVGWVAIMALQMAGRERRGTMVKPWYWLCSTCKSEYDIPDDLEKEPTPEWKDKLGIKDDN